MENKKTLQSASASGVSAEDDREQMLEYLSAGQQNESERRQIRKSYRDLMDDLSENKQKLIDPGDEENLLKQKLKTVDKLFENVSEAREGSLDSTSLVQIADFGMKKAQALQTDFNRFNPSDFCERMKLLITGEADSDQFTHDHWVRLGSAVQHLFNKTPSLQFMYGSFDRADVYAEKKTRTKERVVDKNTGKATQPTQLSAFETVEGGELTTVYVEHVLDTLWKVYEKWEQQPIDFFEFILHPTSFGKTVENIFYTSFLFRDGHAKLSLDSDGLPIIEPLQKQEGGEGVGESAERNQFILEITPTQWRNLVETFKIEDPVIPPLQTTTGQT